MAEAEMSEVEEVCQFLSGRGVDTRIIENFRQNEMTKEAVWNATNSDLNNLGLKKQGHIICLKTFCHVTNSPKGKLIESIKDAGRSRVVNRRKASNKTVYIGWLHYCPRQRKFVSIRGQKGGIRRLKLSPNTTLRELRFKAKSIFFKNGKSKKGKASSMMFYLGYYDNELIDDEDEDQTLEEYINTHKYPKVRLYLMSKPIAYVTHSLESDSEGSIHNDSIGHDGDSNNPIEHEGGSNPIGHDGSSNIIRNDGDSNAIRQNRLENLPEEPNLLDEHNVISVNVGGIIRRRLFSALARVREVYNWVGSMPDVPLHFNLIYNQSVLDLDNFASNYSQLLLDIEEIRNTSTRNDSEEPQEETLELAENVFQATADHNENASQATPEIVQENADPSIVLEEDNDSLKVDRYDIVESLFKLYRNDNSLEERENLTIGYINESGVGEGVIKDVYSSFFAELAKMQSSGLFESVPSSLTEEEARLLGRIISHAYSKFRVFPFQMAKAFIEMLLFDHVRDTTLIESYQNFLMVNESKILVKCLRGNDLNQEETDDLWAALNESNIRAKPKKENIHALVIKAAKYEFIQKHFYIMKGIQKVIKETNALNFGLIDDMDAFYASAMPTVSNVLEYVSFDCKNPSEERVQFYFERYVRSCNRTQLIKLIQYATGSNTISSVGTVKVSFVNQEKNLKIRAKSCFKILYLPRQIKDMNVFNGLMAEIMDRTDVWELP
ncbi:uncharacterized protein [Clytia hemisphaerica]|uniref:uncharacterized protein n=1 Tax=Clytia hemisphaerica TaxID=252671 RepID=UPI0034D6F3E4